jgi:ADP-ribose pyrophosphatase YjhB (NUDIX family)
VNRHYPQAPIFAVSALLVVEGRVLVARRLNPPRAGQWSVPGGVQELGETVTDAVRREVREETGLEVEPGPLLDLADLLLRDAAGRVEYHYVIAYYLAWPTGGRLAPGDDVGEVRWVLPDEAVALGLPRRLLRLIRQAIMVAAEPGPLKQIVEP